MTIKEFIEILSKMDQDKQVMAWDQEWDTAYPINNVQEDDDAVVLF